MAGKKRKRQKPLAKTLKASRRNLDGKEKETDDQRSWSELNVELLELILSRLCLSENIRFSAICKRWHSIALSVRALNQCPWIFFSHRLKLGICEFYDPSDRATYITEIPELSGANICCSKDGWFLVQKGDFSIFFFNPFTREKIDLPDFDWSNDKAVFSTAPTSPSCMVFLMRDFRSTVMVSTHRLGERNWTSAYYGKDSSIHFCIFNPVFCNGLFYSMSCIHKVAVYNPKDSKLNVVDVLAPQLPSNMMGKVLADVRGDLIVICIFYNEEPVILKLDQLNKVWTKVNSFRGITVFASHFASLATMEVPSIMRNSVYFPKLRIFGKRCVSYSLDDNRYYPSRRWDAWGDHGPFGSPMEPCMWIEPPKNFLKSSDELSTTLKGREK